jgi:hypothetical protein
MDDDILHLAAQCLNGRLQQIMSQWARRFLTLHAAVDAGRFEQADQNREFAVPFDFAKKDDLLIIDFADNDAGQFHLNEHNQNSKSNSQTHPRDECRHTSKYIRPTRQNEMGIGFDFRTIDYSNAFAAIKSGRVAPSVKVS